jgi:hypothetical protein
MLSSAFLASQVTVQPVKVANDPGLNFALSNFATVGSQQAFITYTIAAPPSSPMTDASVELMGTTSPGGGFAVTEGLRSNGVDFAALTPSNSSLTGSTTFAPKTSISVDDLLFITNSQLSDIKNQFSETPVTVPVPKPSPLASLALLGVGLSALELVRRRKRE